MYVRGGIITNKHVQEMDQRFPHGLVHNRALEVFTSVHNVQLLFWSCVGCLGYRHPAHATIVSEQPQTMIYDSEAMHSVQYPPLPPITYV